jgi:hypothetical protein
MVSICVMHCTEFMGLLVWLHSSALLAKIQEVTV